MNALTSPLIHVHLVAPPLVAWGLQRMVQTAGAPFLLAATSPTLEEAMPLLELDPPDVVVLDLDDGYGPDDVDTLYDRHRAKVLVLTSCSDGGTLQRVLVAGARGVLQKREAPSTLLKALEAVGRGEPYASRAGDGRLLLTPRPAPAPPTSTRPILPAPEPKLRGTEDARIATLTMRERQTIAAVTADAGAPVKVIADRLCISEHTLRNHLTSIYSKLGVSGRLALYAYVREHEVRPVTEARMR